MLRPLLAIVEDYILSTDDADNGAKAGKILKSLKKEVQLHL